MAGYILDLRNNGGGVFEEAVAAAAAFVAPPAVIATTVRGNAPPAVDAVWRAGALSPEVFEDPAARAGPLTRRPVAVIANAGTASAAEALAGALRDAGRARLFGESTFGKGVIQYFFPLDIGGEPAGGLRLTVSKYLTPSGYDVAARGGLAPDAACRGVPPAPPPGAEAGGEAGGGGGFEGAGVAAPLDRCTAAALEYVAAAARRGGGGG